MQIRCVTAMPSDRDLSSRKKMRDKTAMVVHALLILVAVLIATLISYRSEIMSAAKAIMTTMLKED